MQPVWQSVGANKLAQLRLRTTIPYPKPPKQTQHRSQDMKLRHRTANQHPKPPKQGQHTPEDHHRPPPTVALPLPHQHLAPTQQVPAPQPRGHQPHRHRSNPHLPPKQQFLQMNDDYTSPWPHSMTSISSKLYNRNVSSSKPHPNSSEVEFGKHSPTP